MNDTNGLRRLALCLILVATSGCAGLVPLWDLRVRARGPDGRYSWTLSGRKATLVVQSGKADGKTARNPNGKNHPDTKVVYRVSKTQKKRLHALFASDHIQDLASTYVNRCLRNPKQTEMTIQTADHKKTIRLRGFLPQAIRRLETAIHATLPASWRRKQIACFLSRGHHAKKRSHPQSHARTAGDPCQNVEDSIIHDPMVALWRGRPASVHALAPRAWRLVIHYKAPLTRYYRKQTLTSRSCHHRAHIPQSSLHHEKLFYYLEALDSKGEVVDTSGSLSSPHIVEIHSCVVRKN
jgi:hypothetical protein